jgi:predicted dienelactone hydrolase
MRLIIALLLTLLLGVTETAVGQGVRGTAGQVREGIQPRPSPQNASAPPLPSLPKPAGPYRIATAVFHLTDKSRPDSSSSRPGQPRELMLQIWYPTDVTSAGKAAPFIPNPTLLKTLKDTQHDFQDPAVFDTWKDVQTHAAWDVPPTRRREKFPLLFFSHGLGEPRSIYTGLSEDLASHGYVVVCLDHPYGGVTVLPDGRVLTTEGDPNAGNPEATPALVEAWAKDASFVLDRLSSHGGADSVPLKLFTRLLDFARVGMLGHSLGGAAGLEACRADTRFKACADLDGAPFGKVTVEGLKRPTLVMRSGPVYSDEDLAKRGRTREQWEEMGRKGRAMWSSLFLRSKNAPVYSIKIDGTGHMSYSDAPFVMPDTINRFGGRIIEARRGFRIMSDYIRAFFGKYLRGKNSGLLDGTLQPYIEVSAERFNL